MKRTFRQKENAIILTGIVLAIAVAAACLAAFFLLHSYIAEAAERTKDGDFTLSKEMQDELSGNTAEIPSLTPAAEPETEEISADASKPVLTVLPETQHNMTLTPTPDPQEYWATHPTPAPTPRLPVDYSQAVTSWINTSAGVDLSLYDAVSVATATSTSNHQYSDAAYAFDGTEQTYWCEGTEGDGVGEILYAKLGEEKKIGCISFKLGNWTSYDSWIENGRPSDLTVWIAGNSYPVRIPDYMQEYFLEFSRPIPASELSFRIESVNRGNTEDTYITDIQIYSEENGWY